MKPSLAGTRRATRVGEEETRRGDAETAGGITRAARNISRRSLAPRGGLWLRSCDLKKQNTGYVSHDAARQHLFHYTSSGFFFFRKLPRQRYWFYSWSLEFVELVYCPFKMLKEEKKKRANESNCCWFFE